MTLSSPPSTTAGAADQDLAPRSSDAASDVASGARGPATLALVIAVVAVLATAWQWFEGRTQMRALQAEVAQRLAEEGGVVREVRALSKAAQESAAATQARAEVLGEKFEEFESQQAALEALYQELARSRDEWELAEVDQLITLAAQQLEVAGNVGGATLALTHAESRLARTERPQFQSLHKAVARDLEKLRSQAYVDLPGISARLEGVLVGADVWPLAFEVRPAAPKRDSAAPAAAEAGPAAAGGEPPPLSDNPALAWLQTQWRALTQSDAWRGVAADVWHEIRGLVRIQRFDRPEPVLLPPEQAYFVRQNVKLRLLNARLALLTRDTLTFRAELVQARAAIVRHFDATHPDVKAALDALTRLGAADVVVNLPTIADSVAALRTAKLGQERRDPAARRGGPR